MKNTLLLLTYQLQTEWKNAQAWFSSTLLGLGLLFLFAISFEVLPENTRMTVGLAELFLGTFLILQNVHVRLFEADQADAAQLYLWHALEDSLSFYSAKLVVAILLCLSVLAPYVLGLHLLLGKDSVITTGTLAIVAGVVVALSALGVLLAQVTQRAQHRHLLFPILYFPLNMPVMIMGTEAASALLKGGEASGWLTLLGCFVGVYVTLSGLLFDELQGME